MTPSFGPDAELRWVNWFKLLHSYALKFFCDIGDQKLSQNLHGILIQHRLYQIKGKEV